MGTGLGTELGKTLMCQLSVPDDLPKPAGVEPAVAHAHKHACPGLIMQRHASIHKVSGGGRKPCVLRQKQTHPPHPLPLINRLPAPVSLSIFIFFIIIFCLRGLGDGG